MNRGTDILDANTASNRDYLKTLCKGLLYLLTGKIGAIEAQQEIIVRVNHAMAMIKWHMRDN